MKKDYKNTVTEYARNLSEEDVRLLTSRLVDRLFGDLAEVLQFLGNTKLDDYLRSASSSSELFDCVDTIRDALVKECRRRGINQFSVLAA